VNDRLRAYDEYMIREYGDQILTHSELDVAQAAFYAGWNSHASPRWEMDAQELTGPAKGDRFAGPAGRGL
jgi:hypothetical protein